MLQPDTIQSLQDQLQSTLRVVSRYQEWADRCSWAVAVGVLGESLVEVYEHRQERKDCAAPASQNDHRKEIWLAFIVVLVGLGLIGESILGGLAASALTDPQQTARKEFESVSTSLAQAKQELGTAQILLSAIQEKVDLANHRLDTASAQLATVTTDASHVSKQANAAAARAETANEQTAVALQQLRELNHEAQSISSNQREDRADRYRRS